jgi:hypothetical protein
VSPRRPADQRLEPTHTGCCSMRVPSNAATNVVALPGAGHFASSWGPAAHPTNARAAAAQRILIASTNLRRYQPFVPDALTSFKRVSACTPSAGVVVRSPSPHSASRREASFQRQTHKRHEAPSFRRVPRAACVAEAERTLSIVSVQLQEPMPAEPGKKYVMAMHISFVSAEVPTVTSDARSFW